MGEVFISFEDVLRDLVEIQPGFKKVVYTLAYGDRAHYPGSTKAVYVAVEDDAQVSYFFDGVSMWAQTVGVRQVSNRGA